MGNNGNQLPLQLEAERCVLGSMITLPDETFPKLDGLITSSDFSDRSNQQIFRVTDHMFHNGIEIDAYTVAMELKKRGEFEDTGGEAYLMELMEEVWNAHQVLTHCEAIVDAARRRQVIRHSQATISRARDFTTKREDILGSVPIEDVLMAGAQDVDPYESFTADALDAADLNVEFLIEDFLVKDQPGLIGGPKKSLKTTLAQAILLALAFGAMLFDKFNVTRRVRVGFFSGESGKAVIQETSRRIAKSMGRKLRDAGDYLHFQFRLPEFSSEQEIYRLRKYIIKRGLEFVIIDPSYLFLNIADGAGNLFVVGAVLKQLTQLGVDTGATILLVHHCKKNTKHEFAPTQLEDIAWAGFQEWARQWLLLNRRSAYDPEIAGRHDLSLIVGGSAGHSGAFGLDVDEGSINDAGGRKWQVEVNSLSEVIEADTSDKELKKRRRDQATRDTAYEMNRSKLLKAMRDYPNGQTVNILREDAGINQKTIKPIIDDLVRDQSIEECEVKKNNGKNYDGYKLTDVGLVGLGRTSQPESESLAPGTTHQDSGGHT